MKVGIIGMGNMGLSVAAAILDKGGEILCYDIDPQKIQYFADGQIYGESETTKSLLLKAFNKNRLIFVESLKSLELCDLCYLGVPTPELNYSCNYQTLLRALREYGLLENPPPLIIGSTVFPGAFKKELQTAALSIPRLIYQPVFLRFGHGREDYLDPGKIIFGLSNKNTEAVHLNEFIHFLELNNREVSFVEYSEAEWIKLIHNAFMCLKINFSNEMQILLEDFDTSYLSLLQEIQTYEKQAFFENIFQAMPLSYSGLFETLKEAILTSNHTPYLQKSMLHAALLNFEPLGSKSFDTEVENYHRRFKKLFKRTKRDHGKSLLVLYAFELLLYQFKNEVRDLIDQSDQSFELIWNTTFMESPSGRLLTASHMRPGLPFSGPCLPKDAKILFGMTSPSFPLLQSIHLSNEAYKNYIYEKWHQQSEGGKLGLIGLSFRAKALEFRHSAGLDFFKKAKNKFKSVLVTEESLFELPKDYWPSLCKGDKDVKLLLDLMSEPEKVVRESDSILLLSKPSPPIQKLLKSKAVVSIY